MVSSTFLSTVSNLPFGLYSTFVIEERHGFNKQTLALYLADMIKGLAVGVVIGVPCGAGFLWVIKNTGRNFFVYVWVFL
jgi:STE24 endopeptidase